MATLYVTEFSGMVPDGLGAIPQAAKQPPLAEQTVGINATPASSAVFTSKTRLVRVHTDSACSINFSGNASVSNARMAANQTEYFSVDPGAKVSVIQNN
jgi:hypothetical protein